MRKGTFALLAPVVGALAFASAAPAQQSPWQFSLGAGPSFPVGDLADEAERGFHVQSSVGYKPTNLPAGIRVDLFYQDFDAVEREPSINVSYGGEWYRQLSALVNVVLAPPTAPGAFRPYGLLGGGWMREWHDDRTYSGTVHATFNFNAGAGIEFPLFGSLGFVEARVLNVFGGEALPTTPPAVLPEVQFRSLPLTVGLRF